jgi:hypothetical protein
MHGFIKRFANGVFYPEEVAILTAAMLQATQAPFAEQAYAAAAREILAKQIIMAAQRGERNLKRLTQDALVVTSPLAAEIEPKAAA